MEGAKRDCSLARCCEEGRPSHHARRRMAHACPGQDPEMGVWGGGWQAFWAKLDKILRTQPLDTIKAHTHTRPAPPLPSPPPPPRPPLPVASRRRRHPLPPPAAGVAGGCTPGARVLLAAAAHVAAASRGAARRRPELRTRLLASPSNACLLRRATRACFAEQRVLASPSNACLLRRATRACFTEQRLLAAPSQQAGIRAPLVSSLPSSPSLAPDSSTYSTPPSPALPPRPASCGRRRCAGRSSWAPPPLSGARAPSRVRARARAACAEASLGGLAARKSRRLSRRLRRLQA